jgi:hypothetical protein
MLWRIFIAVLVLSVAAQFFFEAHPHFAPEELFAWNALYGFLACAVLILVAKALGLLIKRDDRYYDDR